MESKVKICPKCKEISDESFRNCFNCGTNIRNSPSRTIQEANRIHNTQRLNQHFLKKAIFYMITGLYILLTIINLFHFKLASIYLFILSGLIYTLSSYIYLKKDGLKKLFYAQQFLNVEQLNGLGMIIGYIFGLILLSLPLLNL